MTENLLQANNTNEYEKEIDMLCDIAQEIGLSLSDLQARRFAQFTSFLLEYNKNVNLTAIENPVEVMTKHYIDSILPLAKNIIKPTDKIIDIGCGAGFPSLPLKICAPDSDITMLDSLRKRIDFINKAIQLLSLEKVVALHGRAEEFSNNKIYREQFDVCVSRAVANLSVLSEYCIPFVKVGGIFAAYKSKDSNEEIEAARRAIRILGGEIEDIVDTPIPKTDITHRIVIIRKVKNTNKQYPRKQAKISANPL